MSAGQIILGMPFADYFALPATNCGLLKELAKSPAHYQHRLKQPRESSDVFRVGAGTHVATLEPESFDERYGIWAGRRQGKTWDAFVEEHGEDGILTEDQRDTCLGIARAVRANPDVVPYITGGRAEVTITWVDDETGIACKARLDYVVKGKCIPDLKTTRDASPRLFARQAWNLQYPLQASWYRRAWLEATGEALPFAFIAAEKEPPHVSAVYVVPDSAIEAGDEQARELLDRLAECRKSGVWPGYCQGVAELETPRWAMPQEDEDLTGLDLDWSTTPGAEQ